MNEYKVWPYALMESGNWSIPDELILWIWDKMCESGREKHVFWNGCVRDGLSFIAFLRRYDTYPIVVVDTQKGEPCAIGWLNGVERTHALVHFCVLGKPWPGIGQAALEYWKSFGLLKVLVGITPETNRPALKYVGKLGFEVVGTIPKLCEMHYDGTLVGGVVTYRDMEGGNDYGRG